MKCWGYNNNGQLGNNSTTQSLMPVNVSSLTSGVMVAIIYSNDFETNTAGFDVTFREASQTIAPAACLRIWEE